MILIHNGCTNHADELWHSTNASGLRRLLNIGQCLVSTIALNITQSCRYLWFSNHEASIWNVQVPISTTSTGTNVYWKAKYLGVMVWNDMKDAKEILRQCIVHMFHANCCTMYCRRSRVCLIPWFCRATELDLRGYWR